MDLRSIFRRIFGLEKTEPAADSSERLSPESRHRVELTDESVTWIAPDQTTNSIPWSELETVEIMTTDAGPFASDVFWILKSRGVTQMIPQGATGEKALLARLQQLPGFDNLALISAMGCTENAVFPIWSASSSETGSSP